MGKHGGGQRRRRPPQEARWYAVFDPYEGVHQGWSVAQPFAQGHPGASSVEVSDYQAGVAAIEQRRRLFGAQPALVAVRDASPSQPIILYTACR